MEIKENIFLRLFLFLFVINSSIDFWFCVCYKLVVFIILVCDIDDIVMIWKCVYFLCNIRFVGKMKYLILIEIVGILNK